MMKHKLTDDSSPT